MRGGVVRRAVVEVPQARFLHLALEFVAGINCRSEIVRVEIEETVRGALTGDEERVEVELDEAQVGRDMVRSVENSKEDGVND